MAARVFDTYMPGGEDPFITFINSISDGRILCLAIMVRNFSKLCKEKDHYYLCACEKKLCEYMMVFLGKDTVICSGLSAPDH